MKNKILAVYFLLFNVSVLIAQTPPNPGNDDDGGPGNLEGKDLPVDQHLWLLLTVGIIYILLYLYRKNQLKV